MKLTVTSLLCQFMSAPDSLVVGAVVSIPTTQLLGVSTWPTSSVERYSTVC